ncbi:YceI family protein [uncultured Amaricoccus sp.]|uniref:YceI family protein n=1 Tax=uncultured Amaricoccus sp. TaxID=339341 RepID=UPI002614AC4E|nr:YceI family protein [uncultured Amaricoccus sp.]
MLKSLLLLLALLPAPALAAAWKLDPATRVTTDVTWEGRIVEVRFPTLSGSIDFDQAHPERARASISVAAGDATTGVAVVDSLLRSRDYLGAAQYPTITFQLDKLTQTSKSTAEVSGRMTLRGVTRPVTFHAQVFAYGPAKDDPDRFEAGFDLSGAVDRTAFGSTGGVPDVASVLPVRIRLLMTSR